MATILIARTPSSSPYDQGIRTIVAPASWERLRMTVGTLLTVLLFACAVRVNAQDTLRIAKSFQRIDASAAWYKGGSVPDSAGFGNSVAGMGDIDRDGIPDLVIGMSTDSSSTVGNEGSVLICMMNANGTVKSYKRISSFTDSLTANLDPGDRFGARVANIGDLNGDGMTDLAVLASGDDDGGTDHGAVYILFLDTTAKVIKARKISDTVGGFTGTMTGLNGFAGTLADVGDMDGDGVQDLGVGAYLSNDAGAGRGALWILLMNRDGSVKGHRKYSALSTWPGGNPITTNDSNFGFCVAGLGDLDKDGVNDISVSARQQGGRGFVYIMFLNAGGSIKAYQRLGPPHEGGLQTSITSSGGHFGWSVDNIGDLNSDGVDDLLLGLSLQSDGYTQAGAALVAYMNTNGTIQYEDLISLSAGTGSSLGIVAGSRFGYGVSALGDIDGDHVTDIVVSANRYNGTGGTGYKGAVFILELNAKPLRVISTAITEATLTTRGKTKLDIRGGVRPYRLVWMDTIPTLSRLNAWKATIDTVGFAALGMPQVLPNDLTVDDLIQLHEADTASMRSGIYPLVITDAADTLRYCTVHVGEALVQSTLTGATLSGKNVTKTASTGWTNMRFTTKNRIPVGEDGWVSFIAPAVNRRFAVGFSAADTTQINGYQQMDGGFYLSNDSIRSWDGGSLHYLSRKFKAGDQFRIERRDDSLYFYHENKLLRTVTATFNGRDQVVDCSAYQSGTQIMQLTVSAPATFHVSAQIGHLPALTPNGGNIGLDITPAVGTYSYDWLDGPATTATRSALAPGLYEVDITSSSYGHARTVKYHLGDRLYWEDPSSFTDTLTNEGSVVERDTLGDTAWTGAASENMGRNSQEHWSSQHIGTSDKGSLMAWQQAAGNAVFAAWWVHPFGKDLLANTVSADGVVEHVVLKAGDRLGIQGYGEDSVQFLLNDDLIGTSIRPTPETAFHLLAGLRHNGDKITGLATSLAAPLRVNTSQLIPGIDQSFLTPAPLVTLGTTGGSQPMDLGTGPATGDHSLEVAATDSTDTVTFLFELTDGGVTDVRMVLNDTTYAMDSSSYEMRGLNELVFLFGADEPADTTQVEPYVLDLDEGLFMTPNGDADHDVLHVKVNVPVTTYEFTVMDRAYNILFQTDDPDEDWNGKYMNTGDLSVQGGYRYHIQLDDLEETGDFLINY